jgi:general nucleoside transport system permease protein
MTAGMLASIVIATLVAGTPLVYAALGELVAEKSGVLNLGIEGMMLVGAVTSFIAASSTHNVWIGVGAGMAAGACLSAVFAFVAITLQANQVAAGLALAIFGTGLSSVLGKGYTGTSLVLEPSPIGAAVNQIPVVGPLLTQLHPLVYLSWFLFGAVSYFLYRTKSGLVLRAVGESPTSAHAIGYPVVRIRYLATIFGGAMAGVAGAYLSTVYTPLWTEGMTAGRGWIALALVVFATWRPARALFGAYLFGGVTTAQLFAQGAGVPVPPELMSSLPYLATIVVLVLITRNRTLVRLNAPAALGQPFYAYA